MGYKQRTMWIPFGVIMAISGKSFLSTGAGKMFEVNGGATSMIFPQVMLGFNQTGLDPIVPCEQMPHPSSSVIPWGMPRFSPRFLRLWTNFLLDAEPGSKPHWWYSFVWKWDAPPNLVLQKLTFSVIVAINWGTLQAKTHPNIMLSLISSLHISSICYKIVLIFFFICLLAHHSVDYTYKYTYTYIYIATDTHLERIFFHFFFALRTWHEIST